MASHTWNGHTIDVHLQPGGRNALMLLVAVDGRRPVGRLWRGSSPIRLARVPSAIADGWMLNACLIPFELAEPTGALPGRVEFDTSYGVPPARYRVFIDDEPVADADLLLEIPWGALAMLVVAIAGGVVGAMWLALALRVG